jgi:hypothetical protein
MTAVLAENKKNAPLAYNRQWAARLRPPPCYGLQFFGQAAPVAAAQMSMSL